MGSIVLGNVTKVYENHGGKRVRALDTLNLTVADRELLVILGPSGSGKTTILRLIAGLEKVSSGTIEIDGKVANDLDPKERDVAMVFQHFALYPHMSTYENMAFGLKLRKRPEKEIAQRVIEAARMLGVEACLERKPEALSGGERQRVALGRAIVRRPRIFLFDEPLSNLDTSTRGQIRKEIGRLHKQLAATMVYVTHDQTEALALGDRIAVIKDGIVQQVGPPMELYHQPQNIFVAGFIGSPPMNFFAGKVVEKEDQLFFEIPNEGSKAGAILPLSRPYRPKLAGLAGQTIVLGVRPEHISVEPNSGEERREPTLHAEVELAEPLGAHVDLHLRSFGQIFRARVAEGSGIKATEQIPVFFDMSRAHFFEAAGGKRIG